MKIRLKLKDKTVDGHACPYPAVTLKVRDKHGSFAQVEFRVDTQADVSTFAVALATKEAVAFSSTRAVPLRGVTGAMKAVRDRITVVIAGESFSLPCDFTPAAVDAETGMTLPDLAPVLGRAGFLDRYAIAVDSGYLIVTRIGPIRRWLRQRLHHLWTLCGMLHAEKRPL